MGIRKPLSRRDFARCMGLGAGTALLGPLLYRLVSEARAETTGRKRLVVMTAGNGFGHQGMERNSEVLNTSVSSPTSWELPSVLSPLASAKGDLSIWRPFENPHGQNLHGNGWATLNVMRPISGGPGGRSLDRWVGLGLGAEDAFPSIALGIATRADQAPPCVSSDGPRQPFPAIGNPVDAYASLFGLGYEGGDVKAQLAAERSLLDRMVSDVQRASTQLASTEREKLEQLLTSFRSLERQLATKQEILSTREPPPAPRAEDYGFGLRTEVIRAHVDLIVEALAFGLTHTAHLSLLGFDAHNAGWGAIGVPGDAHEDIMHREKSGMSREDFDAAVRTIISFQAGEMAYLWQRLGELPSGGGTLADSSLVVWLNSGGGKHHDGSSWHPLILLGSAGGALKAGQYREFAFREHAIGDAFVTIGQALGMQEDVFGDPERCKGPIAELLG